MSHARNLHLHWNLGKRQKSFTVAVFLRDLPLPLVAGEGLLMVWLMS